MTVPGHPHSNIQFTNLDEMNHWGPCNGFGDIWQNEEIVAEEYSDPFLVNGYKNVCLHLSHNSMESVFFDLEIFVDSEWRQFTKIEVTSGKLHTAYLIQEFMAAQWLRISVNKSCCCSLSLHLFSSRNATENENSIFDGLATTNEKANQGILQVPVHNHNLQFVNKLSEYHEINEHLEN